MPKRGIQKSKIVILVLNQSPISMTLVKMVAWFLGEKKIPFTNFWPEIYCIHKIQWYVF